MTFDFDGFEISAKSHGNEEDLTISFNYGDITKIAKVDTEKLKEKAKHKEERERFKNKQ